MPIPPKALMERSDRAWRRKEEWDSLHRTAYKLAFPQRFLPGEDTQTRDRVVDPNVFDSTLRRAVTQFVGRIQADLLPQEQTWAKIVPGPMVDDAIRPEIEQVLESLNRRLFMYVHKSGFDLATGEALFDLSVSKGVWQILEGDDDAMPVRCTALPASHVACDEGPYGEVDGTFRKFRMRARLVEQKWTDARLPSHILEALGRNEDPELQLFEATILDHKPNDKEFPWAYRVMLAGNASDEPDVVVRRDLRMNPHVVARWHHMVGETEGFGPAVLALDDALMLNRAKEVTLQNALMAISGILLTGEGNIMNLDTLAISPGAIIEAADVDALRHVQWNARLDLGQIVMAELIASIEKIMLVNALPPPEGSGRSEFELIARLQELQKDTGPPIARLKVELIEPVLRRFISILKHRKGGFLPELKKLEDLLGIKSAAIDGLFLKIQVISPLAQAENTRELEAFLRMDGILASYMPEYRMIAEDLETLPHRLAHLVGAPHAMLRPQEDAKDLIDGLLRAISGNIALQLRQQAAQTAAQEQQMPQGAP